MVGGFVASLIVFGIGAILDFALAVNRYQHGFNVHTIGIILMVIGAIGGIVSLLALLVGGGWHRRRTIVDDGRGNVVRREDTYL